MFSEMTRRLITVAEQFGPEASIETEAAAIRAIDNELANGQAAAAWLVLSALRGQLATSAEVRQFQRSLVTSGTKAALTALIRSSRRRANSRRGNHVVIVTEANLIDVHHTSRTGLATGIQRVARNTAAAWIQSNDVTPVGWSRDMHALTALTPEEVAGPRGGDQTGTKRGDDRTVIIPWNCRYVLLELAVEADRVDRLAAMAEFSGNVCTVIGFDCVPLTSSETTGPGMGPAFVRNLGAVAYFDAVVAISEAAANEYRGWRETLSSVGLSGPSISAVSLPVEAGTVDKASLTSFVNDLPHPDLPVVLCVGSHEPRKNHGAVLAAARTLWDEGIEFQLVMIGGNAWGGEEVYRTLTRLEDEGKPLKIYTKPSDELLWSAYSHATVSVFPSFNEGYGLPIAESLALGTPVITSGFGSMKEIAAQGGCLLVDPRDDTDVTLALRRALTDNALREHLEEEARARVNMTWPEYAQRVWESLPTGH